MSTIVTIVPSRFLREIRKIWDEKKGVLSSFITDFCPKIVAN